MEIKQDIQETKGAFSAFSEGIKAGAMTFSIAGQDKIIIDHTEVNDAFKGQGVGKKLLLEGIVPYARTLHFKIIPLCPFAQAMFKKMPDELNDLLA